MTKTRPFDAANYIDEEMIERGAQALADDVWHPSVSLEKHSGMEANKFRRQARIVLEAVLGRRQVD